MSIATSAQVPSQVICPSDDSSFGSSSGPSTPSHSPIFEPVTIQREGYAGVEQLFELSAHSDISNKIPAVSDNLKQPARSSINICFIGAGYVGGPTAAIIALHHPNVQVNVVDKDENRIQRWRSAHLPIYEPGLNSVVRVARDGARLKRNCSQSLQHGSKCVLEAERNPNLFFDTDVTGSIARADMIFLAVNTSTKAFGIGAGKATDMSACDSAILDIALHARPNTIIVEKSTVPCGTARRISSMLQSLRPSVSFDVISNPEFLAEGSAIKDLQCPERVIIGSCDTPSGRAAAAKLACLYSAWVPQSRIILSNTWSSELSKLVANAMLAQRISSINSISAICELTGADVEEVARSIGADSRIGPKFLKAGLGFGGSCFKKDIASLVYLASSLGLDEIAEYWDSVNIINDMQTRRIANKIIRSLGGNLVGKKITIMGFAFKANTGDTRESPTVTIIKDLLAERPDQIAIFDPVCRDMDIRSELAKHFPNVRHTIFGIYGNPYEACDDASTVLIATDCHQFFNGVWPTMRNEESAQCVTQATQSPDLVNAGNNKVIQEIFELRPEPSCRVGAGECSNCDFTSSELRADCARIGRKDTEIVDWKRVALGMRTPRWIFDGRNVLHRGIFDGIGVEVIVEGVGKSRWINI